MDFHPVPLVVNWLLFPSTYKPIKRGDRCPLCIHCVFQRCKYTINYPLLKAVIAPYYFVNLRDPSFKVFKAI
nr:hypothetical protein [uncultured bacterium]